MKFIIVLFGLLSSTAFAGSCLCVLEDAYGRNFYEGTGPTKSIAKKRAYQTCNDDLGFFESVAKCHPRYIRSMDCAEEETGEKCE